MWGPLSKTNHQIFCSSTITNSDLPLHISPCALAQFFEPSYKLFLAHNTLTASWAVKKTMKCPMLPKGFPPLNLTAHVEIAFLPLLLCHVFSVLQDYFLSIPAWKKKISLPFAWQCEWQRRRNQHIISKSLAPHLGLELSSVKHSTGSLH